MCRINGACSNLSSTKLKICLKIKDDANTPKTAIKPKVPTNPKNVLSMVLLLKPMKENRLAKKSNNFNKITQVIINGINKIKPCKKYLKNCFIY